MAKIKILSTNVSRHEITFFFSSIMLIKDRAAELAGGAVDEVLASLES